MPAIEWDKIGERTFEQGVGKGVIYMDDGRSIPWNGLVSVVEGSDRSVTPVHYDGMKVNDIVSTGDFRGTVSALTYPDELLELEGYARISSGVYFAGQEPQPFNLTYQTRVGNDLEGTEAGYKIHILYNVTLIPSDRNYQTISNEPELSPFSWTLTTVPQEVPGYLPTSMIILDSREIEETLLADIELLLYGLNTANPSFPEFDTLMTMLLNAFAVDITDLKDGRWMATSNFEGYISTTGSGEFQIEDVDAVYLDADTYDVSDTPL